MIFRDVHFGQFKKEIQDKNIICIGCGQSFHDMLKLWDQSITQRISLVMDNYKQNTDVMVYNRKYRVLPVERLQECDLKNMCILITTMYCKSIFEQLQDLLKDINVACYIYPVMSLKVDNYKWEAKNTTYRIPKKIHYFWFGKGKIPQENIKCIDSWKKYCPDYEIIKWTEDNYDICKCEYMKQAYEHKKWGFVPDFARLDVLYQYGGIYLDTDVELVRNLDSLLYEDAFVGFQRDYWINLGLGCGCKQQIEIFKVMRDMYYDINFVESGKLNLIPSPCYQTLALKRYGLICDNTFQRVQEVAVFPTDVFDAQGYSYGKVKVTSNTYSIHHYSESWVDKRPKSDNLVKYREVDYFR